MTKPLTVAEATEIGGAINDLVALETKSIVEKDDAAKKRATTAYLQAKLMQYSQEFLAAWFTLEQEYKPFLFSQATVMNNVLAICARRNTPPPTAEVPKPDPETPTASVDVQPENVVQLNVK